VGPGRGPHGLAQDFLKTIGGISVRPAEGPAEGRQKVQGVQGGQQRAIWMKLGLPGRAFLQKGACQQHSVQTQRVHYVLHALMRHQGTMLDAEAYQRNVCIVFCTH
jgi:hypothetical protein